MHKPPQEEESHEVTMSQKPVNRPFRMDPPPQEEHDTPENLVEVPGEAEQAARSLEDAADSHHTLQGFYAMNNEKPPEGTEEIVEEERGKGRPGQ